MLNDWHFSGFAISKRNIVLLFFAEIRLEQIGQKFMDSEISRGRVLQQFMPEIVTLSTLFCCNSPPLKLAEMQVVRWLWLQKKVTPQTRSYLPGLPSILHTLLPITSTQAGEGASWLGSYGFLTTY